MFVFLVGWFNGFMKRWSISCWVLIKISSRVPDEYKKLVINWLRFNRRNSQPRNFYERACLTTDVRRYRLSNILNLDETPIPFEYLDGKTYAIKGSKTVSGKTDRSGWDKRQATLILYIFADGVSRIKPKIIFHASSGNNIRRKEAHLWNTEVSVELNSTAYNNEKLVLAFIDDELFLALNNSKKLGSLPYPDHESLLLMDVAGFHTTEAVLEKLHTARVTTSLIPSGCTGLLQLLDTAINKPFKGYLREYTDTYIENHSDSIGKWSVSDKRIMVTHVVAQAWAAFSVEKCQVIQKSFRDLGVTLPVDGSKDHEIRIKGFNQVAIGDWTKDLPLPLPFHPMESHRPLRIELPSNEDPLEFVWACEDYLHPNPLLVNVPSDNNLSLATSEFRPSPGGTLLPL